MNRKLRIMSYEEYLRHVDYLYKDLKTFIEKYNLKIDYLVPVLRSGAVPGVYLANKLNIVKFAPFQVKHITYKDKTERIEIIFNPLKEINVSKDSLVFLIVEGTHASGKSVELCIDEILKLYPKAKILYVCIAKTYGSKSFGGKVIYEKEAFLKGNNLSLEKCKELGIEPYDAIYPWETLEGETFHPDDLEENIFF